MAEDPWAQFADAPDEAGADPWAQFADAPAGDEPARPKNRDDFLALPAGERYVDPSGGVRVKLPDGTSVPAEVNPSLTPEQRRAAVADNVPPSGETSGILDTLGGLGSGLVRGAAETAMLPITLDRLASSGASAALTGAERLGRWAVGAQTLTDDDLKRRADEASFIPAVALSRALSGVQDTTRQVLDDNLYSPKTRLGRAAEVVGGIVPGAVAGPVGSAARFVSPARQTVSRIVGDFAAPAAGAVAGQQMAYGTDNEGLATLVGGLLGGLGPGLARSYSSAVDNAIVNAAGDVSPVQFDAAKALSRRGRDVGVPLTAAEAIQGVTSGATKLGDLLRMVEHAPRGGGVINQFFAQRPRQVAGAVGRTLDTIAPQSPNPSALGPRIAEVATDALDGARAGINRQTRPLYQAAEPQIIDPAVFDPIKADPAFQQSLQRLRADPVLGPQFKSMPDESVAVVDAVTKDMRAQGQKFANAGNEGFNPLRAAVTQEAAVGARDAARAAVPEYNQALAQQEQLRRTVLQPLEQGPLGAIAANNGTRDAFHDLLPQKPLVGGEAEITDAVKRLLAQPGPDAVSPLIRQGLADDFDAAAQSLVSGDNTFAGAKYAKTIAGTPQQRTNLDAVLGALPQGAIAQPAVGGLLDVLRATGQRQARGSATTFNSLMERELSGVPMASLGNLRTAGLGYITGAHKALERTMLGHRLGKIADMFVDPSGVGRIQQITRRGATTPMLDMLGQDLLIGPGLYQNGDQ